MRVVATAGHVDHGKSTLVRALTGTDPDRFAEEKARGLTIDLGFAWCELPSGTEVAFVDVPGHVRFIRNMLAGVGAVDVCVFVVAATEGWKPQSEEHLRILDLLGFRAGVVALTKADLVDDTERELTALEVTERIEGTFLASAPVIPVGAPSGAGVSDLARALDRVLGATAVAPDAGRPRLWVDRVFAARGAGTVVTGTLLGGSLAVGDDVVATPPHTRARVRGLQTHKRAVEKAAAGGRVAVNLSGVDHGHIARGDAIVRADDWMAATTVDASLSVLPSLDHDVSRRGTHHMFVGSGQHAITMRVLGADALAPGTTGSVRIHLPVPLPLTPGDRFVLRESGRGETIGGGQILDVAPMLPASRARPDRSVDRVVAERGWVDVDELFRLTGERRAPDLGRWVVDPAALDAAVSGLTDSIVAAGPAGIDVAPLSERDRAVLRLIPDVVVDGGRARVASLQPAPAREHPYVVALEASPFAPPAPDGVDRVELRDLVRGGVVVERDGVYFAASAVDDAVRRIAALMARRPDGITVADVRDALGSSRKHVLPLLAHLDATGVTRRRGDVRVAGPRLPSAS